MRLKFDYTAYKIIFADNVLPSSQCFKEFLEVINRPYRLKKWDHFKLQGLVEKFKFMKIHLNLNTIVNKTTNFGFPWFFFSETL